VLLGICPEVRDGTNITVRTGATSFILSFNILVGTLSGPDGSRDSRSFCTLSHEITMSACRVWMLLQLGILVVYILRSKYRLKLPVQDVGFLL